MSSSWPGLNSWSSCSSLPSVMTGLWQFVLFKRIISVEYLSLLPSLCMCLSLLSLISLSFSVFVLVSLLFTSLSHSPLFLALPLPLSLCSLHPCTLSLPNYPSPLLSYTNTKFSSQVLTLQTTHLGKKELFYLSKPKTVVPSLPPLSLRTYLNLWHHCQICQSSTTSLHYMVPHSCYCSDTVTL